MNISGSIGSTRERRSVTGGIPRTVPFVKVWYFWAAISIVWQFKKRVSVRKRRARRCPTVSFKQTSLPWAMHVSSDRFSKWRHVGINRGFLQLLKPGWARRHPTALHAHTTLRKFSTLTCRGLRSTIVCRYTRWLSLSLSFHLISLVDRGKTTTRGSNYLFYELAGRTIGRFVRDYVYAFVGNFVAGQVDSPERIDEYLACFAERKSQRDFARYLLPHSGKLLVASRFHLVEFSEIWLIPGTYNAGTTGD